jgi:hypothetical protein
MNSALGNEAIIGCSERPVSAAGKKKAIMGTHWCMRFGFHLQQMLYPRNLRSSSSSANKGVARCLYLDGEEKKIIKSFMRQVLSTVLSFLLVFPSVQNEAAGQQSAPAGSTGYSGRGAPLSAEELQQLVAPIALYPDALVCTDSGGRNVSGPGCCRQRVASAEQEPHGHRSDAGG